MRWETFHTKSIKKKFVYRYLGLEKLISFLQNGSLYLTRLDKFEDNLEGISPFEINELRIRLKLINTQNPNTRIPSEQWDKLIKSCRLELKTIKEKLATIQSRRYVSCWFLGDVESIGMWDLYARDGFALRFERTYFQNLVKSKINNHLNSNLGIDLLVAGKIIYQNFDNMLRKEKESHLRYSVFRKHFTFQHEEEYRIVAFLLNQSEINGFEYYLGDINNIKFDIIANPRMSSELFKVSFNTIKKYAQSITLQESSLKTWLEFRNSNFE